MTYCFECPHCGHTDELTRPMKDCNKRAYCSKCKKLMCRDIGAEGGGAAKANANYPMESDAAGVHPDQIKETMAFDKSRGVSTNYAKNGNPIFTSRAHRARYCRAHGLYDRNAGFGDAAPKSVTESVKATQSKRAKFAKARMNGTGLMSQFVDLHETG